MAFIIKQHDTYPALTATLSDIVGPINLTGATVKVILKTAGVTPTTITGACTITNATAGAVSYLWVAADTASVNTFQGEFEITFANGRISTVPNDSYFSVDIKADLG